MHRIVQHLEVKIYVVVYVYGPAGWELFPTRFKITLPNTDQAHDKISVNHYE
jgi:hypothetical protein